MHTTNGIKSENFVVIQGWMCNELNLKGNDLLVFALIYGFCQDGQSMYCGGRQYIADTFNISVRTVSTTLQSLVEQGLIIKHASDDYVHPDIYTVVGDKETLVGREKFSLGVGKNFHQGSEKIALNNTSNNINNNISNFTNVKLEQATPTHKPSSRHLIDVSESVNTSNITQNNKKKSRYEQCMDVTDELFQDIELRKVLADYLSMRLAIKDKPMYVAGWKSLLRKLKEMSDDVQELIKIVRQSLEHSWAAFYPVKSYTNKQQPGIDKFGECGQVKSVRSKESDRSNVYF